MSYKIGVSGVGRGMGPGAVFDVMPDCKVVAACDPDTDAQERFSALYPDIKVFGKYEDMLDYGLDIVVVGTPIPLHAEQTVAALDAGYHVLQEVTLSDTLEGCKAILDAVKAHPGQKFMMGENCCYWGHILSWKKMWADGMLGDFVYGEAEYVHNIFSLMRKPDGTPTWRAFRPTVTYCSHSLGPLMSITGERCVSAVCLDTGSKYDPSLQHPDFAVAIFKTSSGGVMKFLRAQVLVREPHLHYYSLYGTKGCVETSRPPATPQQSNAYFESIPHLSNMIEIPLGINVPDLPAEALKGGHGTAEYLMISDFMDSVRNDKPSPIDIYAALGMTLPGLFAYESSLKGGEPVSIPDWK